MFGGDFNESSKQRELPWARVRDIMKSVGALMVSKDAVDLMIDNIVDIIKEKTVVAKDLVKNARREKITREDVKLAFKMDLAKKK